MKEQRSPSTAKFRYGNLQSATSRGPQAKLVCISPGDYHTLFEVDGIVDTGGEVTCVPATKLENFRNVLARSTVILVGVTGPQECPAYNLHVSLGDFRFDFREVVAYDLEYATIGRDILNLCRTVFDGPEESWTIEPMERP